MLLAGGFGMFVQSLNLFQHNAGYDDEEEEEEEEYDETEDDNDSDFVPPPMPYIAPVPRTWRAQCGQCPGGPLANLTTKPGWISSSHGASSSTSLPPPIRFVH